MKVRFMRYIGEVITVGELLLFYTFDKKAEGHLWPSICERNLNLPKDAYCFWVRKDEVTVLECNGRRCL